MNGRDLLPPDGYAGDYLREQPGEWPDDRREKLRQLAELQVRYLEALAKRRKLQELLTELEALERELPK